MQVLHNGSQPYPHAVEAVRQLAASGRQILILSNSSRRAEGVLRKLQPMGFEPAWFAGAITSGELAHRCPACCIMLGLAVPGVTHAASWDRPSLP